jgi:hypothetical protein
MKARSNLTTAPTVERIDHSLHKYALAERIEGLHVEMDAALAEGEYERVVRLAEEQEKLLEALMM